MDVNPAIDRAKQVLKAIKRGFEVFAAAMAAVFFLGLFAFGVFGSLFWGDGSNDKEPVAVPSPSASPVTPINWTYQGATCRDGWPSPSIGKRGACSHHGGVAGSWLAEDGTEVICLSTPPRTQELLAELIRHYGRIAC